MATTTTKNSSIAVIDVDLASDTPWSDALAPISKRGQRLLSAFNEQGRGVLGGAGWWTLQRAAGALHGILGGAHGHEIADIADALGVSTSEVVLANAAYDINNIGCSTIAAATPNGPLHARNLDWSFRRGLLKRNLVIARMRNARHGDYALVTWPGMFAALTGLAPGRFSITINFVHHEADSSIPGLLSRALRGYWPVAWVVRRAFDEAKDFKAAVRLLKGTLLLAPVLITVVGTKNDERVVIDCGCDEYALRNLAGREPLCVTNHYVSDELAGSNVDLDDMDTEDRLAALEEQLDGKEVTVKAAFAALSSDGVLSSETQHQVAMEPRTGRLVVRVPGSKAVEVTV